MFVVSCFGLNTAVKGTTLYSMATISFLSKIERAGMQKLRKPVNDSVLLLVTTQRAAQLFSLSQRHFPDRVRTVDQTAAVRFQVIPVSRAAITDIHHPVSVTAQACKKHHEKKKCLHLIDDQLVEDRMYRSISQLKNNKIKLYHSC